MPRTTARRDQEFTWFVESTGAALRRYCVLLTGSQAQADDLLQDSLLKVYLALDRIRDTEALPGYARQVITRTHISWWRGVGRREFATDQVAERPDHRLPDDQALVDQDEVWQLLHTLAPRQRTVLVLRFYEDLAEADIAAVMGCSVGTVKSQLSRGLAHLRRTLDESTPRVHSPSLNTPRPEGVRP